MEVKKVRKKIAIILLFLLALCITECSPKRQIIKEEDEGVLRRRVQEYWSCRIKGEWERCYLYESPDYREKVKIQTYVIQNARSLTKWEGYEIMDLWTSGEEGHVKLDVKYRYLIPQIRGKGLFARTTAERWEKKDGQWYRLSEEVH
jgi:hypothetical protein